ncbi:MAG: hypothetical protein M0P71_18250 [Melioribacteraceae bacterium]|jgi:AraC-like DNA-binding protein|nr:hypothetical protein [Melioribacteraceae bacterium]
MKSLKVEIDESDLFQRLEAIAKKKLPHARDFTQKENDAILKYWNVITRSELARELKCSPTTLLKHYRQLISNKA